MPIHRNLERLANDEFDLVIIGGGIFGACAAWDATLRGMKVALIEKHDFGHSASANSFKIVHGGMRYLQHADIKRLRSSCHERSAFLRIAPHLVQPLPILVPTYGYGKSGKAFLATGLYIYDLLTIDRNNGIADNSRKIPLTKLLSRSEVLKEFPDIDSDGLTGGVVFCDGRMYNPTRLVLSFILSAAEKGAEVANYVSAEDFIYEDSCVTGVIANDQLTGNKIEIKSRTVLNASGPWSEVLFSENKKVAKPEGIYSRDACFVVNKKFNSPYTVAIQGRTSDPDALLSRPARHLFMSPWRDYTLIGVWHIVTDMHPEKINVEKQEIENFIDEINWAYPSLKLTTDDVTMWNAGLVPFGENEEGAENLSYGKRSHILDHKVLDDLENLVSIIGVRYTMARGDSAQAIDLIQKKLKQPVKHAPTDYMPVYGGDIKSFDNLIQTVRNSLPESADGQTCEALAHNYGTRFNAVITTARNNDEFLTSFDSTTVLKAEVIHAIKNEMAFHLDDIVFRRTDLATGGNPGTEILQECAEIAQKELNWDEKQLRIEMDRVTSRFPSFAKNI